MLISAKLQNLTTTPNETLLFSPGINLIIGENGLGKSHILKAIYAILKVQSGKNSELSKSALEKHYAEKLMAVMRPEYLGRLVKRRQGRERCEIHLELKYQEQSCAIGFASNAKSLVEVIKTPREALALSPVFFPTRELATLSPWFVPLYDNYHIEFEETWRDTVSLLGAPSVKGPRENVVAKLLSPLEDAMGGKVEVDANTGRFYLKIPGEGRMEMALVAEGLRKLAMLARLISTGVLLEQGYLFWDEPETNLNPKLIKTLAECIFELAKGGIQVFVATHSLFLMREIQILQASTQRKKQAVRYFALNRCETDIELTQGDSIHDVGDIAALDESLKQADRYLALDN